MAKGFMSDIEISPRTDNPEQEAVDYTNDFKDCIQRIAAPQSIPENCFEDYLDYILPLPRKPSEESAYSKAKSKNGLHFWSSWLPWLKWKILKDNTDYERYQAKEKKMNSDADEIFRRDYNRYEQKLSECNELRCRKREDFNNNDKEIVQDYFTFVLENDCFSIDLFNNYHVDVHCLQYDEDEGLLSVQYRIPAKYEILPLDYFYFDEKSQAIRDRQLSVGVAVDFRNDIARRVLLRVAASLYVADELSLIDTIELHGFLDDDSTDGRRITVISLVIPRKEIVGKTPEFINTKAVFIERFQEERSPDLYKAESYQLRELLSRPRSPKRKLNTDRKISSNRSKKQ